MGNQRRQLVDRSKLDLRGLTDALIGDDEQVSDENALVPLPDGSLQAGDYLLSPTGLQTREKVSYDSWEQIGKTLQRFNGAIQWWIGDWFLIAERQWGKTYEAVAAETSYAEETLKDFAYVARNVELSVRTDQLSFGHHKLLAALDTKSQRDWIAYAIENKLSISQLRKMLRPTPSKDIDRVGEFQRELIRFHKEFQAVGQGERMQMISLLETLLNEWRHQQ